MIDGGERRNLSAKGPRPVAFVSRFLLPLVKGGPLHVGRPLGARAVAEMTRAWQTGTRRAFTTLEDIVEEDAIAELTRLRQFRARALLFGAIAPPVDETTLRLAVGVHNLLALGHPGLAEGLGAERKQAKIVEATLPIADVGPPSTAEEAVRRHSLLGRLVEITRTEHTVEYWAGRRRFVGRQPPAHVLALPALRRVSTTTFRRLWFKEIGVPVSGRPLWVALHRASPLGEALDPLRLDPPLGWDRILRVLRFPVLCRLVASRLVDVGIDPAGSAMVAALVRFASIREPAAGASAADIAFAIRFLAHATWLHHLFGGPGQLGGSPELVSLLAAAFETDLRLVWPADVAEQDPRFAAFRTQIAALGASARARAPDRYQVVLSLCRFAVQDRRQEAPPALL